MNRRRALTVLGTLTGLGLAGRYALLPPSRSRELASPHELAIRFYDSLGAEDRKRACVEYDDPLRQYHNRGVWGGGLWVNAVNLGWEQRGIVTDLLYAGLSEQGRQRVPNEFYTRWSGVHSMYVRIGGRSREGAAFGGPLVYGDQRGDSRQGLPGNLYRFQFEIAQRLFRSLRPEQQQLALQKTSPIQTDIQQQGSQGVFAGVEIATLPAESRTLARELIDGILSTYPAEDAAYAWECLEHNGGPERLFLSYYADSEVNGSKQYQNFRLEGPSAVFYFRGHPHVHAFINVGMNGDAPLSVGELLGDNPAILEGGKVKRLFEAAMQDHAGSDFAYYDLESVAGRLRKGSIRTGDIYTLESWQDSVTHVEIKGSNLSAAFIAELRGRGIDPDPRRVYAIATTGYVSTEAAAEKLGKVESLQKSIRVRDAAIAYLKKRGFSAAG
jgi:hypothetical protein